MKFDLHMSISVCWQMLASEVKSLCGDLYHGKIEQRVCLKFFDFSVTKATDALKNIFFGSLLYDENKYLSGTRH